MIGGGPGGGTVARYVNKDLKGAVEVTLIEPQKNFTTCFFSNIYVGGYRDFKSHHAQLQQGAQGGRQGRARGRDRHRPRQEGRGRSASSAFPTTAWWSRRHRHQVRQRARLFGSRVR